MATMVRAEMVRAGLAFSWRRRVAIGGMVASVILMIANPAQAQTSGGPGDFADVAEKVAPAVIAVSARTAVAPEAFPNRRPSPRNRSPAPDAPQQGQGPNGFEVVSMGAGFFISPDGYAVTNSHVVEGGDTAEIRTSDDKRYPAKVVGKDSLSDLALIKAEGRSDFAYVKLSDQSPRVGDWVLAIGNSFGLAGSVVAGIVSARERNLVAGSSEGFLQIDAPINQGDSGGPSFNTQGEVVGVNSMILSPGAGSARVAFAIPADTVKTVIPQLKDKGSVTRGSIGAEIQSVTPDIAESLAMHDPRGAIVIGVEKDGPAARAGLRSGDVISQVGTERIKGANELTRRIHAMAPGSSTELTVLRQGQESPLSVTLGRLPDQSASSPIAR